MRFVETWPEARVESLKQLVRAGASASVIAAKLSIPGGLTISRCAVIGKCHRLKLVRPPREMPIIDARKEQRNAAQRKRRQLVASSRPAKPRPPRAEKKIVQELQPLNLTLMDLTMRDGKPVECRFITNDDLANAMYCGHAADSESSWCPYHRLKLQPPKGWIAPAMAQKIAVAA